MSADCFQSNPLVHGGSSQDLRMVPALQPSTAPMDGRGTGQMILFIEKYGTLLNYYDSSNSIGERDYFVIWNGRVQINCFIFLYRNGQ